MAAWSPPSNMIGKKYETLAEEYGEKVNICKVDIEQNIDSAEAAGVESVPTIQYYIDAKKEFEIKGASIKNIKDKLIKYNTKFEQEGGGGGG